VIAGIAGRLYGIQIRVQCGFSRGRTLEQKLQVIESNGIAYRTAVIAGVGLRANAAGERDQLRFIDFSGNESLAAGGAGRVGCKRQAQGKNDTELAQRRTKGVHRSLQKTIK
jgi:hypothetical protein